MKPKSDTLEQAQQSDAVVRRKLVADFPSGVLLSVCVEDLVGQAALAQAAPANQGKPESE